MILNCMKIFQRIYKLAKNSDCDLKRNLLTHKIHKMLYAFSCIIIFTATLAFSQEFNGNENVENDHLLTDVQQQKFLTQLAFRTISTQVKGKVSLVTSVSVLEVLFPDKLLNDQLDRLDAAINSTRKAVTENVRHITAVSNITGLADSFHELTNNLFTLTSAKTGVVRNELANFTSALRQISLDSDQFFSELIATSDNDYNITICRESNFSLDSITADRLQLPRVASELLAMNQSYVISVLQSLEKPVRRIMPTENILITDIIKQEITELMLSCRKDGITINEKLFPIFYPNPFEVSTKKYESCLFQALNKPYDARYLHHCVPAIKRFMTSLSNRFERIVHNFSFGHKIRSQRSVLASLLGFASENQYLENAQKISSMGTIIEHERANVDNLRRSQKRVENALTLLASDTDRLKQLLNENRKFDAQLSNISLELEGKIAYGHVLNSLMFNLQSVNLELDLIKDIITHFSQNTVEACLGRADYMSHLPIPQDTHIIGCSVQNKAGRTAILFPVSKENEDFTHLSMGSIPFLYKNRTMKWIHEQEFLVNRQKEIYVEKKDVVCTSPHVCITPIVFRKLNGSLLLAAMTNRYEDVTDIASYVSKVALKDANTQQAIFKNNVLRIFNPSPSRLLIRDSDGERSRFIERGLSFIRVPGHSRVYGKDLVIESPSTSEHSDFLHDASMWHFDYNSPNITLSLLQPLIEAPPMFTFDNNSGRFQQMFDAEDTSPYYAYQIFNPNRDYPDVSQIFSDWALHLGLNTAFMALLLIIYRSCVELYEFIVARREAAETAIYDVAEVAGPSPVISEPPRRQTERVHRVSFNPSGRTNPSSKNRLKRPANPFKGKSPSIIHNVSPPLTPIPMTTLSHRYQPYNLRSVNSDFRAPRASMSSAPLARSTSVPQVSSTFIKPRESVGHMVTPAISSDNHDYDYPRRILTARRRSKIVQPSQSEFESVTLDSPMNIENPPSDQPRQFPPFDYNRAITGYSPMGFSFSPINPSPEKVVNP